MFTHFYHKIVDWLKEQNRFLEAKLLANGNIQLQESPPDTITLWSSFLKTAFPNTFFTRFFYSENNLSWVSKQLLSFNAYAVEHQVKRLLKSTLLTSLPISEQSVFTEKILCFHRFLHHWIQGDWHPLIIEDKPAAVTTISNALAFNDEWICAEFLALLGYLLPTSQDSFRGWLKYSEGQIRPSSYSNWYSLLNTIEKEHQNIFKLDRLLDPVFNPKANLLASPLCRDRSSCQICPLQSNCHFYHTVLTKKNVAQHFNEIKTGNLKEIPTESILVMILQDMWDGSEFQKHLLSQYPNVTQSDFLRSNSDHAEKTVKLFLAVQELAKRQKRPRDILPGRSFTNASELFEHFKYELADHTQESFYTVVLDNKHRIITYRLITLGTLNQSLVHPREVFAPAVQLRAAAIILIHNHPSGDPAPSQQDLNITNRLKDAGEIIGIKVLDHLIIGTTGYFSFVDEDLL